ncbi:MAG TPA: hypothetical protein VMB03_28240 [Bryobacteraceae bacterium]|nr:hypothetical protein [Bryobacteraceae bacterium]
MASSAHIETVSALVCQRVDVRTAGWNIVYPGEILYAFLESEILGGHVHAEWAARVHFEPGVLYLRTAKGVFRTRLTGLTQLTPYIVDYRFVSVNRSLVARLEAVRSLDIPSEVGIAPPGASETLHASHRNFEVLLAMFGIRRRDLTK